MSKLFLGGVPTKPEVEALLAQVDATPGSSVSYDEIARIISTPPKSNRFRTIVAATGSWRRRLFKERGVQSRAEGGAVHFLTDDGAQDDASYRVVRIGRATGRLVRNVSAIREENLSTEERRFRQRLMTREAEALLEAVRRSAKTLAIPKPISSPRVL